MSSIDVIAKPYDKNYKRTWVGSPDKSFIFLQMYIQEKYKDIAYNVPLSLMMFEKDKNDGDSLLFFTKENFLPNFSVRKEDKSFYTLLDPEGEHPLEPYKHYKTYVNKLKNNKKRFLIFKYSVFNQDERVRNSSHAVLILYDRVTKELEFFQRNPGTERYSPYEDGLEYAVYFFKSVFGKGIKPVYNKGLCIETAKIMDKCEKYYRKQYYKIDGDCLIWVLWYLEFRLKNKDIPRRYLVNRALKSLYEDSKICEVILGYRKFIDDFTDQFIVTYSDGKDIKLNKKKTTPLLKKAEKLIKEYLFYTGIFKNKK